MITGLEQLWLIDNPGMGRILGVRAPIFHSISVPLAEESAANPSPLSGAIDPRTQGMAYQTRLILKLWLVLLTLMRTC